MRTTTGLWSPGSKRAIAAAHSGLQPIPLNMAQSVNFIGTRGGACRERDGRSAERTVAEIAGRWPRDGTPEAWTTGGEGRNQLQRRKLRCHRGGHRLHKRQLVRRDSLNCDHHLLPPLALHTRPRRDGIRCEYDDAEGTRNREEEPRVPYHDEVPDSSELCDA